MKTFITNTKAGNDIKQTFIDLTNQRFGKLVVLELDKSTQFFRHKKWICQCDCGKTKSIRGDALKGGLTKSCGCIAKEKSAQRMKEYASKTNEYKIINNYVFMTAVNSDDVFVFDSKYLDLVLKYSWYVSPDKYAKTNFHGRTIQLHKLITNTKSNEVIDHICGYQNIPRSLNNLESNLRIVNSSKNQMNRKIAKNNSSGVVGVSYCKDKNKWRAYIGINKNYINLGYYDKFEDAVLIRKQAEQKYFGEYSYDNSKKRKENE